MKSSSENSVDQNRADKSRKVNIDKLGAMIKDIRFAMLSTADADGAIRSRPMGTLSREFDGELWFFTREPSGKVQSIQKDQNVNLAYSNPDHQRYASVTGRAEIVHDKDKMAELWNPLMKAWFPEGLEDPEICLLKVSVESAELWDSPPGAIVRLVGFVEALATGKSYDQIHKNQNQKIDLGSHH